MRPPGRFESPSGHTSSAGDRFGAGLGVAGIGDDLQCALKYLQILDRLDGGHPAPLEGHELEHGVLVALADENNLINRLESKNFIIYP